MTPEERSKLAALHQLIQSERDPEKLKVLGDELNKLLVESSRWNAPAKPPEK